jgi:hypothetical protein
MTAKLPYPECATCPLELATHAGKIQALEERVDRLERLQTRLEDKLDALRNWMMGTLAAALLGVAMQLVKILATK